MNFLQNKHVWQSLALFAYFGLLALLTLWAIALAPPQQVPIVLVLLFYIGPLLLPLRGLLYGNANTYALISLLVLFYFVTGVFVLAGGDQNTAILATLEIGFSVLLFVAALAYVRCHQQTKKS